MKVVRPSIKRVNDVLPTEALGEIIGHLKSYSSFEGTQLREILENPHLQVNNNLLTISF